MSAAEAAAHYDVIVIGAGVTGLSSAWWCARDGLSVLVLDKGVVGAEASSRNGGGASHYQSPLFAEEQRLWPMMDDLLGYPTEYRRQRVIMATRPGDLEHYHKIAQMCIDMGWPVDPIDGDTVRAMVPFAGETCLGGIHLRFGGHANPQRSVQAFAWALQDHGGRIIQHCPVTEIQTAGGKVTGVVTPQGTFGCGALVVAAGPQIEGLLAPLGIAVPLMAGRAEMIVTEPAPLMDIGGVDGNGLYGRQTLRGNLAFGGGPHEWIETQAEGTRSRPTSPLTRSLARRVAELFPKAAHLNVIRSWAGIIEKTPDGRPILDRIENLVIATMSGVGFGLSPATGHAVRDLVVDGACSFADISKLNLARFAGLGPDWRAAQGWTPIAAPAGSIA